MFWKKKTNKDAGRDPFHLEFEEGPRYYYRVAPAPGQPVSFRTAERAYQVLDISAGGLGLRGPGLHSGMRLAGVLHLPGGSQPVPLVVVLRNVSASGVAGGQIEEIREEDRERIHLYVLARQKEEIEAGRRLGGGD